MGACLNCNTREMDASIWGRVRLAVSCVRVIVICVCSTRFMRQMTMCVCMCVCVSDCVDEYACCVWMPR